MKKRPNIVVFMTDQQNGDTIRPDHMALTPNIEEFCRSAVVLEEAFCPSPHCCPSRATFFTGLYPSQHGVWHNVEIDNAISRGVYDGVTMFPELLREKGYRNFFSGKWHVSAYEGPMERGFEKVLHEYISNYGRFVPENIPRVMDWKEVYNKKEGIDAAGIKKEFGQIARKGYPYYYQFGSSENPYGDTTTVEEACKLIAGYEEEEPFFLYVGTTGPHDPYCPPQEYIDMYKDVEVTLPESFGDRMEDKPALYRRTRDRFDLTEEEQIECTKRYLAFVSYEDALFGKLLQSIKEKGIYEDTYVFYLTDHGDYLGSHGLWTKGLPCFREAYHICGAVGGGAIRGHKVVSDFISLSDFAPTILELAGVETEISFAGRSFADALFGKELQGWRTEMHTQTNGNELYGIQRAVWNRKWKYVFNGFDYDELYDLEKDPLEMRNLIKEKAYEEVVEQMCGKMWEFARDTGDNGTCPYIMVSLAPYGPGIICET